MDDKPEETVQPETIKLSPGQAYPDTHRMFSILGLKEYKKIKGDLYTDTPKKGKKFLVLFLSIGNATDIEDYINYNYISAKVDGKKITHTFLVNEPKGYPTIFTHIPAGGRIGGFIVWEVPSGWKKFKFYYNGWKDINNISMEAEFAPKDL